MDCDIHCGCVAALLLLAISRKGNDFLATRTTLPKSLSFIPEFRE